METSTSFIDADKKHIKEILNDRYDQQEKFKQIKISDFHYETQVRIKMNVKRYIDIIEDILLPESSSLLHLPSAPPKLLRSTSHQIQILFDDKPIPIRKLKAVYIGKLVNITGIVTRMTKILPKLEIGVYCCILCSEIVYQNVNSRTYKPIEECPKCKVNKILGKLFLITRESKFVKVRSHK